MLGDKDPLNSSKQHASPVFPDLAGSLPIHVSRQLMLIPGFLLELIFSDC